MRHTLFLLTTMVGLVGLVGQAVSPAQGFSTFLQQNANIQAIAHDSAGNLYIAGNVFNSPIPGHGADFYVTRLDAGGTRTAYFVYLGGSGADSATGMAVDADGNAYVVGETTSADFPSPSQTLPAGSAGRFFAFVVKLDPTGHIVYSTLLENQAPAGARGVVVDATGSAIVTGYAGDTGFPSIGGAYSVADSKNEPFVARLDPTGSKLVFSATGVGGLHIAIGPQGDLFVSGNADSSGTYPITPGAFQTTVKPSYDCAGLFGCFPSPEQYVTRLTGDGRKLVYSTYISGTRGAQNQGLAVDSAGNAYVTGTTNSTDYPVTLAQAPGARPGLFLTRLDPTGSRLAWSVQQGGTVLALDPAGNPVAGGPFTVPAGSMYQPGLVPPYPPTGDTPASCVPLSGAPNNGFSVQLPAYVQRFNAADGSLMATQIFSAREVTPAAIDVTPDGRTVLGGYSWYSDIALTPGVVFSNGVAQPTVPGAFLAAFDLATSAVGGKLACVADGFSSQPVGPVAPGQLITLYGTGLGPAQGIAGSISGPDPATTSLGGVSVTFDGVAAPLAYAGPSQINASVPFEVATNPSTVMKVMANGNVVASRQFAVAASSPGLFIDTTVYNQSCGVVTVGAFSAVALNADGSRNSCANPAKVGSTVTIFLNGVGPAFLVNRPGITGSITGPNPNPFGLPVDVVAGTLSLEAGPLTAWPGLIAGLSQLPVKMPDFPNSNAEVPVVLTVSVAGVPAAPFMYFQNVEQLGGAVWVAR